MSKVSSVTRSCKFTLFYYFLINGLVYFVESAVINRDAVESVEDPGSEMLEDMKVVESEELPEVPRKALFELIQKNQFFQDIFSEQPDPMIIQFGHVCENPNEWEQRFEQRDYNKNHFKGKMRWGNKNGDYGEHYWDLGHAG